MSTRVHAGIKNPSAQAPTFMPANKGLVQRKCAEDECRKKKLMLQRYSTDNAEPSTVPPIVHEVLRSPGQPLDPATRAFMEPRFGHDFSKVRVHTDAKAAESARIIGAGAYTVSHHVVFGSSRYAPDTIEGKLLMAHELAHFVQQENASTTFHLKPLGEPDNPFEVEADLVSRNVIQNRMVSVGLTAPVVAPQFGLIGCMWWLWRFSKYIDECSKESEEKCGEDLLSNKCQKFMDGAGFESDAILKCVGRKNPKALAKLLASCATVSLGQILKGPRASLERPSGTPPPEFREDQPTSTALA